MCSACRFCLSVYFDLSPRGMTDLPPRRGRRALEPGMMCRQAKQVPGGPHGSESGDPVGRGEHLAQEQLLGTQDGPLKFLRRDLAGRVGEAERSGGVAQELDRETPVNRLS